MFEVFIGLIAGGAIMYFIQPWVKDTVTKAFAGAPALFAKAEALQARAQALIDKAHDKIDANSGPNKA